MYEQLLYFSPFLPATILAAEDLKYRQIHLCWVIVLAIAVIAKEKTYTTTFVLLSNSFVNILVICLMLTSIILWLLIKNGKPVNPFIEHFGSGDLLFICSVAPAFHYRKFILFLIVSFTLALLFHLINRRVQSKFGDRIPLVTILSAVYLLTLILKTSLNGNPF
jgi:hypothetical protein